MVFFSDNVVPTDQDPYYNPGGALRFAAGVCGI